jgi:hypothetical protein
MKYSAPAPEDNYVAYLRFQHHGSGETTIHVCDSDAKGAFKVYRRAPAPAPAPRTYTAEEVDAVILEVFATHYWHGAVGERHSFGGFRNYIRARLEGKEPR